MVKKKKKYKRRYNPYRKAVKMGVGLAATGMGLYAVSKGLEAIK